MSDRKVLVVGLDSADAGMIRRLADDGRMPELAKIRASGKWSDVRSNAVLGSASIWPSFMTGRRPEDHGIYNEWAWDAATMSARRPFTERLDPFWRRLVERELPIGVFDVPFAPFTGVRDGFEVNEWGAHDRMRGTMHVAPDALVDIIEKYPRHPYSHDLPRTNDPRDTVALQRIARAAEEGIRLRSQLVQELIARTSPRFTLVVFPELHDAGHFLWHTVEPGHPTFADADFDRVEITPSLEDLHVAVDKEIAALRATCGSDCDVAVISLHGMRAGIGWPVLAPLLLEQAGLIRHATWRSRTLRDNLTALFRSVKRRAPKAVRDLYRKRAATALQIRLARPTMIADYDWRRTQAFPVMDDHAGFIRINLAGRERDGIVEHSLYGDVLAAVRQTADVLRSDNGAPLVDDIVLPQDVDPLKLLLPDLVVHWTDEAFKARRPVVGGIQVPPPMFPGRTGRHDAIGFCVANGRIAAALPDRTSTEDLHGALMSPLGEG